MTPKKALVVDDSRSARYSLRKTLERLSLSVDCVESGETALNYLKEAQDDLPDVIFMDNLMPGMNGFSTSEAIQKQQNWQHIPIIMCTATQGAQNVAAARHCGATGLLPKPATTSQIQKLLAQLADGTHSRDLLLGPETSASRTQNNFIQPPVEIQPNQNFEVTQWHHPESEKPSNHSDAQNVAVNLNTYNAETFHSPQTSSVHSSDTIHERVIRLEASLQQWTQQVREQITQQTLALIKDTLETPEKNQLTQNARSSIEHFIGKLLDEKISTHLMQIEEKIESQTRGIEHRLMGEALNNEQLIEQAVSASSVAAAQEVNQIKDELQDQLQSLLKDQVHQVVRAQAEQTVSDNIQRLQNQVSQSVQAQLRSALRRQTALSLGAFSLALLSVILITLS